MFLIGALFQQNFAPLQRLVRGKFALLLIVYCLICWAAGSGLGWMFGNSLSPLLFTILSLLIFAAAYSHSGLSDRLLRRNDISYGIYIYHMPVVNFLLTMTMRGSDVGFAVAMIATTCLAAGSWILIERPALTMKKHPLYQHAPSHG
jgi:peptidoglycan/LPS O-acetylase OafA/YrhL